MYDMIELESGQVRTTQSALSHVGVKGMKWGVRKRDKAGSGPAPRYTASSDAARAVSLYTKASKGGSKALSNKDMQELVNRMNLEQQYARLKNAQPETPRAKAIALGRQIAVNMIASSAKAALPDFIGKKAPALKPFAPVINAGIDNMVANAQPKRK